MYKKLVENISSKLNDYNKETCFVSFKGFPNYFIKEIAKTFPFYTDTSVLFENEKINLNSIFNDLPDLIKGLKNKTQGVDILLYEELIQLQKNYISIPLQQRRMFFPNYNKIKFIIIENNHLREYPNQSNRTSYDIDENIEDKLDLNEDDIFNAFYTYSSSFKNVNLIKYQDVEFTENFKRISIFPELSEINYQTPKSDEEIDNCIDATSIEFQKLKYRIFLGEQIKILNVFIENYSKTVDNDLRILNYIFSINNYKINVFRKDFTSSNTYRPELLNILLKHWQTQTNPIPKFRNLHFYKSPETGKDKIEYSQGAIAEIIIKQIEKAHDKIETNRNRFKNIFITAPTGSGKAILYQIPALYIAETEKKLVTIVIVPLIALMESAVNDLKGKYKVNNCAFINSSLTYSEREQILQKLQNGEISILFLSPELFISFGNLSFLGKRKLGLVVIDEAHTVSTWGQEFRADYWNLGNHIRKLKKYDNNQNFPIVAMTATATYGGDYDMVSEIIKSLHIDFPEPILLIGSVRRNYISFKINPFIPTESNRYENEKKEKTKKYILDCIDNNIKSLIYFPWVRTNNEVFSRIPAQSLPNVVQYHGKLSDYQKKDAIYRFSNNLAIEACVTKAFGMGIDIPDIKNVYHFAPSGNLSDYVQEIGRLRSEKDEFDNEIIKYAVTDFGYKDLAYNKRLFFFSSIKQYEIRLALKKIHSIFEKKRRQNPNQRNFLVSIDDFTFITGENNEDKIKRMLLMIERDFHPYIIIRPRSIFSTVFAEIPDKIKDRFLEKYGAFCEMTEIRKIVGNVFKLELDKIWEHAFRTQTFPQVKKEFYEKTLFKEFSQFDEKHPDYKFYTVYPNLKLSLELIQRKDYIIDEIKSYLEKITIVFTTIGRHYFSKEKFSELLTDNLSETELRERLIDNILLLFSRKHEIQSQNQAPHTFLIWQYFDDEKKYIVDFADFGRMKKTIISKLNDLISVGTETISTYITANSTGNAITIRILYLLEIMQLATYELSGGEKPQIFIRINDPDKLEYQVRMIEKYRNSFITKQNKQFERNNKIFQYFFNSGLSDNERWDFIENYFLGKTNFNDEIIENEFQIVLENPIGENNGAQLAALVKNIQKIEIGRAHDNIVLDFSNISFVFPLFALPLSVYLQDIDLKFRNHEKVASYLDTIRFFQNGLQINPETDIEKEFKIFLDKNYIGIICFPVAGDDKLRNYSNTVISKIETLLIEKANLVSNVMQSFKYLVAEIIDNVFEHSGTNKAWIFAQYYPTKEYFDLCILDVGKGILGSYKEKGYEEIETDKDAVINAISGNSTKEYYNERGKGLTTTINLTRNGFNGDYILISGDVMFFNEKIIQMPISWQGTIVCFRLNKNKPNLNLYNYVE